MTVKAKCESCGKQRSLVDHKLNQFQAVRWCSKCVEQDSSARSKAATGKAGRPAKTPSQLEDHPLKCTLTAADARALELWLLGEGYTGTIHQMLKQWILATIKARRHR